MTAQGFLNTVAAFFVWLWGLGEVRFMVAHIGVNIAVALAAAIRTGEFKWHRLGEFLYRKLLPFVIVYGVARALGDYARLGALAAAVFGLIEVSLLGDLADSLGLLGIKLPDTLRKG